MSLRLRLPCGPSTRTGRVRCDCDGFHRQRHGDEATASRQARHVFFTSHRGGGPTGRSWNRVRLRTAWRAAARHHLSPRACLYLPARFAARGRSRPSASAPASRVAGSDGAPRGSDGWAGPEFGGWQRILERYASQGFGRVRGGFYSRYGTAAAQIDTNLPLLNSYKEKTDLKHRFKGSGVDTQSSVVLFSTQQGSSLYFTVE